MYFAGDGARRDEDGYFWFQARADDMIISGGYNISGPEVEWALLELRKHFNQKQYQEIVIGTSVAPPLLMTTTTTAPSSE